MTSLAEALRAEHRGLRPHIEALREAGDSVGEVSLESLRRGVDQAHEFLAHHLIPHAQAEERALYPAVAKAMGTAEATATISRTTWKWAALLRNWARSAPSCQAIPGWALVPRCSC
jgi:hemerythrin-like domain-containing protein